MSSASRRPQRPLLFRLALALVVAVCAPLLISISLPAAAAGIGVGWDYDSNSHLGAYTVGGRNAYCINPGVPPATAATADAGLVTSFTSFGPAAGQNVVALSADTLGKVNYLITKYGQTSDRDVAAAVAMAVATTANPAAYAAHTAPWGDNYYVNYMPAADFTRVKTLVAQYRAEAAAFHPAAAGKATIALSTKTDNSLGALTVTSLDSTTATATITLTNATFVSTGTAKFSGTVRAGTSLPITAVAPAGATHYRVSAHADFVGGGGPAGRIHLWTTPGRQSLATPGGSSPTTFAANAVDAFDRTTSFAPVVTTQVSSAQIAAGATSTDSVAFSTTMFTDPVSKQTVANPWPSVDATPVPVTAVGTWYGPSLTPLTESATPPTDVPVAGHATIVAAGPGTQSATSDTPATTAGYYTWVWVIDPADQPNATAALLPKGYRFSDTFGLASESQVSPTELQFATQLASPVAAICDSTTDVITPAVSVDSWLQAPDHSRIPVTLTGRVYHLDHRPTRGATVPTDATLIATLTQVIDGPEPVTTSAFGVGCSAGFTTVRWSIELAAQPEALRGLVRPWADDFGVPSETVQVLAPTITTLADSTGPGAAVRDVATVSGTLPAAGLDLTWAGYLRPADSEVAVCDSSTLAFSSAKPTFAGRAGSYPSETFTTPADFVGSIDWIETARLHGTATIVQQGECGAAGETSLSAIPTVITTPPTGVVAANTRTRDTLIVDGWVPQGATVVVRLYRQQQGDSAVECRPGAQVGDVSKPVAVASGHAVSARYLSPLTAKLPAGQYGFVEQLLAPNGAVIAEGRCGAELFTVAGHLASTGADGRGALIVAALGGLLISAGLFGLSFGLRRRARG